GERVEQALGCAADPACEAAGEGERMGQPGGEAVPAIFLGIVFAAEGKAQREPAHGEGGLLGLTPEDREVRRATAQDAGRPFAERVFEAEDLARVVHADALAAPLVEPAVPRAVAAVAVEEGSLEGGGGGGHARDGGQEGVAALVQPPREGGHQPRAQSEVERAARDAVEVDDDEAPTRGRGR